jgi:hypothetical protein
MNLGRREDARREVLGFLAARNLLACRAGAIRSGVNREGFDFSDDEILGALQSLVSGGYVAGLVEPLGSTMAYQATLSGTLLAERS